MNMTTFDARSSPHTPDRTRWSAVRCVRRHANSMADASLLLEVLGLEGATVRTAETRTAARSFTCQAYRCDRVVQPGEEYARHVAFPGDEANSDHRPWVLKLCRACQCEYDQPMPPRRSKARAT